MPILSCLQELQRYHDLLPDLHEQQPVHQRVLRSLPVQCLGCLDSLGSLALSTAEAQALTHSRQLCQQAVEEARARSVRWHVLRAYLQDSLAVWQPLHRQRVQGGPASSHLPAGK